MKLYLKPELNDEEVELEDIIASSNITVNDAGDIGSVGPDGDLGDF